MLRPFPPPQAPSLPVSGSLTHILHGRDVLGKREQPVSESRGGRGWGQRGRKGLDHRGPPGHGRPEEFGGVFSSVKWGIVDELNKETHGLIYIF